MGQAETHEVVEEGIRDDHAAYFWTGILIFECSVVPMTLVGKNVMFLFLLKFFVSLSTSRSKWPQFGNIRKPLLHTVVAH